ncbi:MAG: DUF3592 domain-containing protein [Ruminococcus sp.]|nr:DUF3592 domain-containing protein [Ruminococcus sp.]
MITKSHGNVALSKPASTAVMIVMAIVTFAAGFLFLNNNTKLKKECTYETTAIVTDIVSSSSDSNTYAPVYSYTYEGQDYTAQSRVYSSNLKMHEGDEVEFYVNPDDPQTYYCPQETSGKTFAIILFVISGICLIVSALYIKSMITG